MGMFTVYAQTQISGTVLDANGEAVPGASIRVKGYSDIVAISDLDGGYTLSIPSEATTIVFSFIGMKTKEVEIGEQTTINVTLENEDVGIDEVVVTAYGSKRKGAISGSIDVVDAAGLEKTPMASFDQMLQGKTTGVQVRAATGRPGASADIKIRGHGSIGASTDPLFVVDGVPVDAGNFSALNPNDIENLSVLKDASATALYGSRASNGVILVTTKKGKKGSSNIKYSYQFGFSDLLMNNLNMMNAEEKLQYEVDLGVRDPATVAEDLANAHDWTKTLTRQGITQSHQLAFDGGTDKTSYYLSVGKYDQEGVVDGSYFNRISTRFNITHKVKDNIKVGNTFSLGYYKRGELREARNVQNPFTAMFTYNPYEPEKLEDGSWNRTHAGFSVGEALENNPEFFTQIKAVGSLFAEWEIIDGLTFKTMGGMDYSDVLNDYYNQPGSILASYIGDSKSERNTKTSTMVFTNTLNYNKTFADSHSLNFLAGTEYNKYYRYYTRIDGQNFPNASVSTMASAADISDGTSTIREWSIMSYFANVSYGYEDKYFTDIAMRRDGSSRFGANNKWGNFWSAGISWNMHKESFMDGLDFINRLKLRASIGTSGNFDITNYGSLGLYSYDSYGTTSASVVFQIENPDLTWEKSFSQSYGLDYSLFSNRLFGTINYYIRNTTDLLMDVPLSYTSGFGSRLENVGELLNKGVEFEIFYDVLKKTDLTVNLGFSISHNKNEVVSIYGGEDITGTQNRTIIREGYPINNYYMVRYAGVNPANGEALYYDANGEVTNVYNADDNVLLEGKTPHPKYFGSFMLNVDYKGFQLSANLYYNYGNYVVNGISFFTQTDGNAWNDNQDRILLDAWKQPGDITDVPRQDPTNNMYYSTRFLEDASYLRLRDLSFSYSLPTKILKKIKLKSTRVFIKGSNLWTYAPNFTGFDPEISTSSDEAADGTTMDGTFYDFAHPAVRTFTFGVEVGF